MLPTQNSFGSTGVTTFAVSVGLSKFSVKIHVSTDIPETDCYDCVLRVVLSCLPTHAAYPDPSQNERTGEQD